MADPKGRGKGKGTTVPLTTFLRPEASDWADEDPDNEQGESTYLFYIAYDLSAT